MAVLTEKQRIFCAEYLVDLCATKSAIRAGYSHKTARSIGQENLTKPDIQTYISELKKERSLRLKINADAVVQELAKIAFASIDNFVTLNEKGIYLIPSNSLTTSASAIELIKVKQRKLGPEISIKLKDSLKALELLGRHLGIFNEKTNRQKIKSSSIREKLMQVLERNT